MAVLGTLLACEGGTTPPPATRVDAQLNPGPDCRGPGHYQAGKEGSYRPCCAGLTQVQLLSPAYNGADNSPVCTQLPLNVYACVRGTCGDGICEEGEGPRCGCLADCPGAAWGPRDNDDAAD
jgi:hypothetical protein